MHIAKRNEAQEFILKQAPKSDIAYGMRALDLGRYHPKLFACVSADWQGDIRN
jgi:hypothetical protein